MFKVVRLLILLNCLILQACQSSADKEVQVPRKPDLNKAAAYNMQLGLGYLKQGDRPRAKKKLLTALDQAPNYPDVNAAIAYYFEQTKELDRAKKYYLKAISLSSNSGAQLNNYGTFLCRQGEYIKAELYFLRAVNDVRYVHTSGAYENAGLCSLAIPDYNKAKYYFTTALNQDPSRRESLYELVKLESKLGDNAAALKQLQKYPALVSNDRVFLALAKEVASKAGDVALSEKYENDYKNMELGS
ncbi:MAG: type IV pilus biogenesis/stability protein PilW [Legionellales bacterium]